MVRNKPNIGRPLLKTIGFTHFSFHGAASRGHKEITKLPQNLHTGWQSWSTTNPFLKISTKVAMPMGGVA